MAFKVQVLYRDGYAVADTTYIMVGENDLFITDNTKSGCNAKVVKAFDTSRTEYLVAETVDALIDSANGVINQIIKSYYALLSQSATAAPDVSVMNGNEKDYLGDIVWTRTGAGVYIGTLTGAFVVDGTFVCPVIQNDNVAASVAANVSSDYIEITTTADDKLTLTPIEIKVFYNITLL